MDTLLSFKNVDGYGRVKVLSDLNFEVYRGGSFRCHPDRTVAEKQPCSMP